MASVLRATIQAIFLAVAFLVLCVPAQGQFTSDYQTNTISAVVSNWPGDYRVGDATSSDLLQIINSGVLSNGNGYIGYQLAATNNAAWISGTGSVWSNAYGLYVGYGGPSNRLTITAGGAVDNGSGYLGCLTNSTANIALVTGNGSAWRNNGDLNVGYRGSANQLIVSNQSYVESSYSYLGYEGSSSNNSVLVTGNGSVWHSRFDLQIGNAGRSNQITITDGGRVENGIGYIGYGTGDRNVALVTGAGSLWTNTSDLYVGYAGAGNQLNITSNSWVRNVRGYIGNDPTSSNNSVLVTDSGSVWHNSGTLAIGWQGAANQLTITNSGRVESQYGDISYHTGSSNNIVIVTGNNSVWANTGTLSIGTYGAGNQLVITDSGRVENNNGHVGYDTSGSNNAVTVTGTGSVWSTTTELRIGYYGVGNQLTITNGGRVENSFGCIGRYGGSDSNAVLVTGSGSVWSNLTDLHVGSWGSGNQLTITNGGQVENFDGYLGRVMDSRNNGALVAGSGSVWSNRNNLYVGYDGDGNQLSIIGSSRVENAVGYIGYNASGSNNSALVAGSGSIWSNRYNLHVGYYGAGNHLTITNGGRVENGYGYLGYYGGGSSNSVLVAGSGSLWTNRFNLYVGTRSDGNQLIITNGGRVESGYADIGSEAGGSNNFVLVTGSGSVWNNRYDLSVGASGANNQLTIAGSGAVIVSGNVIVGYVSSSTNNTLRANGGALSVTNALGNGVLDVRRGTLRMDGGSVTVDRLFATNGANSRVQLYGGVLNTRGTTVSNTTTFAVGPVANTATLNLLGGSHSFANGLKIANHGTLTGSGTIIGIVTNKGSVTPAPTLSVTGDYTDGLTGSKLNIHITGPNTCGQLNVSGQLNIGGTLNVILDGYTPRSGEQFLTVYAPLGVNGTFAVTNLPTLWPGLSWSVQYLNGVTLSVNGCAVLTNYDLYASYYNLGSNSELADANNNGIPNLMEYGLGRDPTSGVYRAATTQNCSNGCFQIGFTRNTDASNIAFRVEAATYLPNGGDWSCILSNINNTGWLGPAPYSETPVTDGVVQVIVTDTTAAATNRFLRLRITRP